MYVSYGGGREGFPVVFSYSYKFVILFIKKLLNPSQLSVRLFPFNSGFNYVIQQHILSVINCKEQIEANN